MAQSLWAGCCRGSLSLPLISFCNLSPNMTPCSQQYGVGSECEESSRLAQDCEVILKFLLHTFAIWGLYKGPTAYVFVAGLMIDKHQKTQCFQISEFLQFLPSTCNLRTQMNLGCEPGMSRYATVGLGILMHWAQELRRISLGWWTPDAAPERPSRQSC